MFEMAICDRVGVSSFETEETLAMGRLGAGGSLPVQTSSLDKLLLEQKIVPRIASRSTPKVRNSVLFSGANECFSRYKPKLILATHGKKLQEDCCHVLNSWQYEFNYMAQPSEDRAELFAWPRLSH